MQEEHKIFSNERVSASAGSGKTHSLTSRFIALSQYEKSSENLPNPTNIIALTFTKKSAGEFLRKILTRLSSAVESESKLKELSDSVYKLSKKNIDKNSAQTLLEEFVKNIDKLKLSTIDSFFSSVLKVFANEIGIFTPMQIMDTQSQVDYQKNIIEAILEKSDFADKNFRNFIEIVKKDSGFNKEFLSLNENLQKAISNALYFYNNLGKNLSFADASIFKNSFFLEWNEKSYNTEVQELQELLPSVGINQKSIDTIIKNFKESNDKQVNFSSTILAQFTNAFAKKEVLGEILSNRKSYEIPHKVFSITNSLLQRLHDAHLEKYLSASKEMAKILKKYKAIYFREITSKGMLSFADVPELLNSCEEAKDLLEFRLDAKFKHWLFDEFQDTSRTQWKFFSSIVDRILDPQDGDDPTKTFYYVGDIKQSIYSWRGGDKDLFKEIFEQYKTGTTHPIIESEPLSKSYRSHANVIKILNEIFNKQAMYSKYLSDVFTQKASDEFLEIFDEHLYNAKDSEETSLAQLKIVKKLDENENFYDYIYEIIQEVQASGKSIGILVNKNSQIQAICDYLKAKGVQVAPEGTKNLAQNNMLAAAFIQLLKHLSYPKDTASLQYLKMTPFAALLSEKGYKEKFLRFLSTGKYADFLNDIHTRLKLSASANYQELLQACKDFENSKKRSIDKVISFLEKKEIALSSNSNFVQVMTVHKSKGLEFSVVILPHLESLNSVKFNGLQVLENEGKSTISYMPTEAIISLNKVLQDTKLKHKNNAMFENLCKFYVALTRAENALYIVLKDTGKTQSKIATLLSEAFFRAKTQDIIQTENLEIYNIGNTKYYKKLKVTPTKTQNIQIKRIENPHITEEPIECISPSKSKPLDFDTNKSALSFGSSIHKVLEKIELDEGSLENNINKTLDLVGIENTQREVILNLLIKFFKNPEIKDLFKKAGNKDIENEFEFNSEINGKLTTGQIDKLILEKDAAGKVISAKIIDFKSTYDPSQDAQLALYKAAVESICELDSSQVSCLVASYSTACLRKI